MDVISSAIEKCPFLHELSVKHGTAFARHIATEPTKPAGTSVRRPLLEEEDNFYTTFNLFHGNSGVVPLQKPQFLNNTEKAAAVTTNHLSSPSPTQPRQCLPTPFASISLSMGPMPDPGKGKEPNQRKGHSSRQNLNRSRFQRTEKFKPISASASGAPGPTSGGCPLRQWLGPIAPAVFNSRGKLQCPEVIVQMRAALSRTDAVRTLRPQGLPIKLVAVGATAAAVNIPCGAIREHFDKFSLGWFLAVHASIPFVAMLRKAVVMPKFAIAMTVAAAIAGQVFGSRLERYRLAQVHAPRELAAAAPKTQKARERPAHQLQVLKQSSPKACPLRDILFVKESNMMADVTSHQQTAMFAHLSSPIRVA